MSIKRAIETRKEELIIMKKRLKEIEERGDEEEVREAERRIKLANTAIKKLGGES